MKKKKTHFDDPRKERIYELLKENVHVVVDRPIGYDHKSMIYPINYGYIPGIPGGDGEDQDVYILGIDTPLTEFDGWVIGGVRRFNDEEDKLIVAERCTVFHQAEIAEAVYFQEQYFDGEILSMYQKSCGVVPYREVDGRREFLIILDRHARFWGFPKGHMEVCETEMDTAQRELLEEVGLTAEIEPESRTVISYPLLFARKLHKQVAFFRGKVSGEPTINPDEVADYKWVTEEEAWKCLLPGIAIGLQDLLK